MSFSVHYNCPVIESDRVLQVANVFGLDTAEEITHKIFDDFDSQCVRSGDIILISGASGAGKSSMLRALSKTFHATEMTDIFDADEIVIDGLGESFDEATKLLSYVGLSEAMIMYKRYSQLSDGQKYRYRIAKMLGDTAVSVIAIDEFASLLDTITAQIVSFGVQKSIRKMGKTLFCATCRDDIGDYLMPSLRIKMDFSSNVVCERRVHPTTSICPLLAEITYSVGTKVDYMKCPLLQFHYRPHGINSAICILFGHVRGELVSVLVAAYPNLRSKGRNLFTNNRYMPNASQNASAAAKLLNAEVASIKRIVVDPRYRGAGFGVHIVTEYIRNWATRKLIETESVMAKYNPFFERSGMQPIEINRSGDSVERQFEDIGFDISRMRSRAYNALMVSNVGEERVRKIAKKRLSTVKAHSTYRNNNRAEELLQNDLPAFLCLVPLNNTIWLGYNNDDNYSENPPKTEKKRRVE